MFKNLIRLGEESGYLIDDRGIKYVRGQPVKTADIKFYGSPFQYLTPSSIKELSDLQKELETLSTKPNAWLDAGKLKEGFLKLELPDMDVDGSIQREPQEVEYEIHRIEFYRLGV